MQDTLNFPTTTTSTTRQPLSPPSKLQFSHKHHTFPSFPHPKLPSKFPSLSSKTTTIHPINPPKTPPFSPSTTTTTTTTTTTIHHPHKPSKTQPLSSITTHHPSKPTNTQPLPSTTTHHPLKPSKTQHLPTTTTTQHHPKKHLTTTTTTIQNHPPNPTKTQPFPSTTTTHHPLTPSKTPPLPSTTTTNHHPKKHLTTTAITTPNFQEKLLFLDSIGLDSLTHLPPSAIAAVTSLSDLKSLIDYLTFLNFTLPQLRRIFTMCPKILSLNLHQVAPIFAFLLREVSVQSSDLPRVITSRPHLLISDVETRLRPTLYFLQSIGIHQVNKHTNLLSASVEDKYIPKIHFFENVGFSYYDSISMFRRFPPLFCYSVKENFEPKFNYFVVEMGRDLKELKEFPQYFSFSLDKRIKPRHQICVETGVGFPLPIMLKTKEDEFLKRLDVCCDSSMPKTSSPLWMSK